jgi:hypothetical protein
MDFNNFINTTEDPTTTLNNPTSFLTTTMPPPITNTSTRATRGTTRSTSTLS